MATPGKIDSIIDEKKINEEVAWTVAMIRSLKKEADSAGKSVNNIFPKHNWLNTILLFVIAIMVAITMLFVVFIGNDVKQIKHYQEIESGVVVDSLMQI